MRGELMRSTCVRVLSTLLALSALPAAQDRAHVRKLSGPLPVAHVGEVQDYLAAPGGQWVVYRADATVDARLELYSLPADGSGAPRALCGPLATDIDVQEY